MYCQSLGKQNHQFSPKNFGLVFGTENLNLVLNQSPTHTCRVKSALTLLGLTGFDMSSGGRACDPICSESLNGAKTELPTSNSLLPPDSQVVKRHRDQKWRTGPIHRSPATEAGDDS